MGPSPSILAFNPDDELASDIIRRLAEPRGSLDAVAKAHGISLADLALWLTTPRARELMLTIEQGGCAHVRMTATLNLSASVHALVQILQDFTASRRSSPTAAIGVGAPSFTPSSATHSPSALRNLPPAPVLKTDADSPSASSSLHLELRHAEIARKAAYHLLRLSRIVPLDDADLARARTLIDAARPSAIPTTATNTTSTTTPTATPTTASATTSRIEHSEPLPQPTLRRAAIANPASSPSPSPPPSDPLPIPHSPLPSPPLTCGDVLQALETYAASVGMDMADLEGLSLDGIPEDVPIPPEALALFPPEIAAFLLAPPPLSPDPHPPPALLATH